MTQIASEIWLMVFALAASGVLGGLLAGLLGVGGGIVIVPVLFSAFEFSGIDASVAMKVAVGTSLATIVLTSMSSARSHFRRGAVDTSLIKKWIIPVLIGVVFGTLIAGHTDGEFLTGVFGCVALLVAINVFLRSGNASILPEFPNAIFRTGSGVLIGLISSMMGIGGGTLSVPILTAFGFDIRRAVATSALIGLLISIPGTIGYFLNGLSSIGRPPWSLGNVNLLAFFFLVPLTTLFAPVGARIAHSISPQALRYCFGVFLLLTAIRMLWSTFG